MDRLSQATDAFKKGPTPGASGLTGTTTGIELTLRNLSLSVIPPPSLLTRVARKLRIVPNPDKTVSEMTVASSANVAAEKTGDLNAEMTDLDGPSSPRIDRDLRNVGVNIFRNVDLKVKPGQVCIILGGSGSGKTTLLNTIAGRMNGPEVVISGSIQCNGIKAKKFWNDGSVGYLQQNDFLMPFLT
ncbi:hypothetical protein BX616_005091, partial [Lobosporangium transversale]